MERNLFFITCNIFFVRLIRAYFFEKTLHYKKSKVNQRKRMYLYFWLIKCTVRRGSITFVETNLFFVIFRQKEKFQMNRRKGIKVHWINWIYRATWNNNICQNKSIDQESGITVCFIESRNFKQIHLRILFQHILITIDICNTNFELISN